MMGDDIFELGVENKALSGKLGEVDEKWLGECKNRIRLSYDDARKNHFILERMKRQTLKLKYLSRSYTMTGSKVILTTGHSLVLTTDHYDMGIKVKHM